MTKYFVDFAGKYIGGFDGAEPPKDTVEVPQAPEDARNIWANGEWQLPLIISKTAYQRQRAAEYPPITDYVDGVVKGDAAQVQTYIDACLAVKAKYPKPA